MKEQIENTVKMIKSKMIASSDTNIKPSDIYRDEINKLLKEVAPDLLHKFWQRTSDACPFDCTEAGLYQKEFKEWVLGLLKETK